LLSSPFIITLYLQTVGEKQRFISPKEIAVMEETAVTAER